MNWQDDPEILAEVKRRGVRSRIVRSAVLWTPLFLAALFGTLYYLVDTVRGGDNGGTWVLVVVLAVLTALFGFQSIQSLLDLRSQPLEEDGFVTRRWSRSDSFVMKSHYIRLERRILRGDIDLLATIKETDYVHVTYYPHSAVIVWIDKMPPPEGSNPATERPKI